MVPAHGEAKVLDANVRLLHAHLSDGIGRPWRITIAENASTDATPAIADRLAAELPSVAVRHRREPGRGGALREAWLASDAPLLAYTDADLSTDLGGLAPLLDAIDPTIGATAEMAIGSRLVDGASVERAPGRELTSRAYNVLVRAVLRLPFHDAQCGFKAIRADAARALLPQVADEGWFWDTELLTLAHRAGLQVDEVPVRWVEDPDSSVRVLSTALADLRGLARMATRRT